MAHSGNIDFVSLLTAFHSPTAFHYFLHLQINDLHSNLYFIVCFWGILNRQTQVPIWSCDWVRNFHWHQVQTLVHAGNYNLFLSWSRNSFSISAISWYPSHIIKSSRNSKQWFGSIPLCRQTSVDLKTCQWKVEVKLISCIILIFSFHSNKYIDLFVHTYVLHIVYVLVKICEPVNVHCLLEN